MRVSVVIPALNEAAYIGRTLEALAQETEPKEILVVDGGSTDATTARAERHGARVLTGPRGRGRQMNAGAARASGEVLFFLHADTLPPPGALALIRQTLADPSAEAGAFRLAFDHPTPLLRFYGFCTRLPWPAICFGDRSLFVRRPVFEALGGFSEAPLFEDLDLVRRLHRRGGFRFRPEHVVTAARRFEAHGALRQQLRNLRLWLHFLRGTDPHRLAHLYPYPETPTEAG
ncbi:TIGR04283 family arsenosugar biosynthesis glycosyltransferase [Rhodocaloribacter litoris]|uniref:TIGR04283 family arsenosugar biosynthesis glycosyltransferase n=1 Tax=Rhodocaloribacter litoris TaxID=2558931 RepID=UPI00141F431B|nr:TIGR04283 family arsenosugar biosynthesis glycosyltransferase [Rhodocaloribacter litoris]QXD14800.1 TIGR04283 family arsenosugar biosynthesis glycosyltransferase [Rhodocaloribacter litoris]